MTASIRVTSSGIEQAIAGLAAAAGFAENPTPALDAIGAAMVTSTQIRFERQQAPDGSPWPPSIRALTEGGLTLQKSGRLVQSVTHRADPTGVEWGTDVIYAGVHQFGAIITPKSGNRLHFKLPGQLGWRSPKAVTIPQREFLGVDDEDEAEILSILTDFANGLGFEGSA